MRAIPRSGITDLSPTVTAPLLFRIPFQTILVIIWKQFSRTELSTRGKIHLLQQETSELAKEQGFVWSGFYPKILGHLSHY